jgi:hypothetical protein
MRDLDLIAVQLPNGTLRRLAKLGFPHDLEPKDIARFLIEQGLVILERRDNDYRLPDGGVR